MTISYWKWSNKSLFMQPHSHFNPCFFPCRSTVTPFNKTVSVAPPCKESLPIPILQNIQHVQLSTAELDAIQGAIKHDPVNSTLYCLTLRGWPDCLMHPLALLWCPGWAVPREWYPPEGKPSLHPPRTPWPHPCRPPQSPSGDEEYAGTSEGSSLLAKNQCQYCRLPLLMHHMPLHQHSPCFPKTSLTYCGRR